VTRLPSFCAALVLVLAAAETHAMSLVVAGDQLILTGPVVAGDYQNVGAALDAHPEITTVVLRYSTGGDASTGYRVGNLIRARKLTTGVSGFCYSSCSRMFLGGTVRMFTDDFPATVTELGLHGHYDRTGHLNAGLVERDHLKDWIISHTGGKADPALVDRWIHLPLNGGMIHFYNPRLVNVGGAATFLCEMPRDIFSCEKINTTALDQGIVTTLDEFRSNDRK
jgi:hypothetical protein